MTHTVLPVSFTSLQQGCRLQEKREDQALAFSPCSGRAPTHECALDCKTSDLLLLQPLLLSEFSHSINQIVCMHQYKKIKTDQNPIDILPFYKKVVGAN